MENDDPEGEVMHRIGARIPADQYRRLCERAKKNRRSINDEFLIMLDEHLESVEVRVKAGDFQAEEIGQRERTAN